MEMLGEVGVAFQECLPLPLALDVEVFGGGVSVSSSSILV